MLYPECSAAAFTEMCSSSTTSGEQTWGLNVNILTSHQFVGQFRQSAALFKAHHRKKLLDC
jgi:hypothetical protein